MKLSRDELRKLTLVKLLALLRAGKIDPKRARDVNYILDTLSNVGVEQGLAYRIWVVSESEFMAEARLAAKRRSKFAAILLLFTAVEHITNHYVRVFGELRGLPEKAVDAMLFRCSHEDKITWLGSLLGFGLPERMATSIAELRSARNKIVHFPQLPMIASDKDERPDSWSKLQDAVSGLRLSRFLSLPESLREHLERAYQSADPVYAPAVEMLESLIDAKKA